MRLVEELSRGLRVGWLVLDARVSPGRFPEESNVEIRACLRGECGLAGRAKAFTGRRPYYRAWIEFFDLDPALWPLVEPVVLDLAAESLGPGERIYVEYSWDPVTLGELERGVPPAASRIGYELVLRGFTWLKDWYYPEGFMEGSQKLQGEKPLDPGAWRRHLEALVAELDGFLERPGEAPGEAVIRASRLRRLLGAMLSCPREP